jgi:hypothetical protein
VPLKIEAGKLGLKPGSIVAGYFAALKRRSSTLLPAFN